MLDVIRAFRGVPHRMEIVREHGGVTFVNDSIATAPERVLAALRSYDEPLVLLLGGRDKKLPWEEMMTLALRKVRLIVAFGEAADLVARVARAVGGQDDQVVRAATLEEALALAVEAAQPGDVVLLSPGGTSYDAYVDFAQRGEHYRQLVLAL
jgi:UDP-N-acetylmuramoylalanine--D-glutamate ligase